MNVYQGAFFRDGQKFEPVVKKYARQKKTDISQAVINVSSRQVLVIQKLLNEYPLYQSLPEGEQNLRLLIIGGQKEQSWKDFLDFSLQLGQMKDVHLYVTVLVKNPEEACRDYLAKRTDLPRFMETAVGKNQLPEIYNPEKYGQLRFVSASELCSLKKASLKRESCTKKIVQEGNYQYIFVAMDSASDSQKIKECFAASYENPEACTIVSISPESETETNLQLNADFVSMAFCANLVWENTLEKNMQEAFTRFLHSDAYALASSLAYVLSVKYKLHSIGIDGTNEEMAEAFQKLADQRSLLPDDTPNEAEQTIRILSALEHRRWVLEKIKDGWHTPYKKNGELDLEYIVSLNDTKDKTNYLHPCIVFSRPDTPLSSTEYTKNHHEKWEKFPLDKSLDELDAMSVRLHQLFRQKADEIIKENPMKNNADLHAMRILLNKLENQPSFAESFRQYEFCLMNILSGSKKYAEKYAFYQTQLTNAASVLPQAVQDEITHRTEQIAKYFFAVREACLFRDYKENDTALILQIPFILTFRPITQIAAVFTDAANSRNESVFQNVASLTVLSPQHVHYIFYFSPDKKPDFFGNRLFGLMQYLERRPAPEDITLAVACHPDIPSKITDKLRQCLKDIQKKYPRKLAEIQLILKVPEQDAGKLLLQTVRDKKASLFDCSTPLFGSVMENAEFFAKLKKSHIPYFEFDSIRRSFRCSKGCTFLNYIHTNAYLRVDDMFALMGCRTQASYMPALLEQYKELWKIYTGNYLNGSSDAKYRNGVLTWNTLSQILRKYEEKRMPLFYIPLNETETKTETLSYTLPQTLFSDKIRTQIFPVLKDYGMIASDSQITSNSIGVYSVEMKQVKPHVKRALELLFKNNGKLEALCSSEYPVQVVLREDKGQLVFNMVDLNVKNISLTDKSQYRLLETLLKHKFIFGLETYADTVSFSYASPQIEQLLSQSGQILELYVFYEILVSGWFDNVVCNYKFSWIDDQITNELDVIATKGFRSFIIECKAVKALEVQYYYKLHSLSQIFGINVKNIMVGNLYMADDMTKTERLNNFLHQKRGNSINIISLTEKEKLNHVAEELIKIASES